MAPSAFGMHARWMAHMQLLRLRQREETRLLATQGNAARQTVTHDTRQRMGDALAVDETIVSGNARVDAHGAGEIVRDHSLELPTLEGPLGLEKQSRRTFVRVSLLFGTPQSRPTCDTREVGESGHRLVGRIQEKTALRSKHETNGMGPVRPLNGSKHRMNILE